MSQYIVETNTLSRAMMIGTLHAIYTGSSGGIGNMGALQSHLIDEHNPFSQIREESMGELQDAISRNFSLFYRRAYRYVGDPHDAEDAVQDAFLSAYRHLDQFKGTAKMTTWLTSIVTNSALTKLRRRPRHLHTSLDERIDDEQDFCVADTLADSRPSPEGDCITAEMRGRLVQLITELSPSLRKAIQLRYLDGLSTNEAARILGVSDATVKVWVSRARAKLKRLMGGVEWPSSSRSRNRRVRK
jgi:RNA polymerase sigma-70 factor, ECF subfamily